MARRCSAAWVLTCLVVLPAAAQDTTGAVTGVVASADGVPLPEAEVVLEAAATGYRRTTATDARGAFRAAALPPGAFTLTAARKGFLTVRVRVDVPLAFVDELQVRTGGLEAEFGRATGGVVNMVTKSGSNQLRGDVHPWWSPENLQEQPPSTTERLYEAESREGLETTAWLGDPWPGVPSGAYIVDTYDYSWDGRFGAGSEAVYAQDSWKPSRDPRLGYSAEAVDAVIAAGVPEWLRNVGRVTRVLESPVPRIDD